MHNDYDSEAILKGSAFGSEYSAFTASLHSDRSGSEAINDKLLSFITLLTYIFLVRRV